MGDEKKMENENYSFSWGRHTVFGVIRMAPTLSDIRKALKQSTFLQKRLNSFLFCLQKSSI